MLVAHRLGYVDQPTYESVAADLFELGRMATGLLRSLGDTPPSS
jgi:hypothetical protein